LVLTLGRFLPLIPTQGSIYSISPGFDEPGLADYVSAINADYDSVQVGFGTGMVLKSKYHSEPSTKQLLTARITTILSEGDYLVVTASDSSLIVWNSKTDTIVLFEPDISVVVSDGLHIYGARKATIFSWNLCDGKMNNTYFVGDSVLQIIVNQQWLYARVDRSTVDTLADIATLTSNPGNIRMFDKSSAALVRCMPSSFPSVALQLFNNRYLISAHSDGQINVYDPNGFKLSSIEETRALFNLFLVDDGIVGLNLGNVYYGTWVKYDWKKRLREYDESCTKSFTTVNPDEQENNELEKEQSPDKKRRKKDLLSFWGCK